MVTVTYTDAEAKYVILALANLSDAYREDLMLKMSKSDRESKQGEIDIMESAEGKTVRARNKRRGKKETAR